MSDLQEGDENVPREEQAIDLKYCIKSQAEAYERNVLECQLSSCCAS